MPKFIIEREIPNAGSFDVEELKQISKKSNDVLCQLGTNIQWIHSYVAGNKIYCIYRAPNEEMVRQHAERGGFPANSVAEVKAIIDPTTAE